MTLNEWEQSNIEVLTSREMGEWLCRRENRLLDKIRTEIKELIDWHDCPMELDNGNDAWYCEACNQAISIIDKHIKEYTES